MIRTMVVLLAVLGGIAAAPVAIGQVVPVYYDYVDENGNLTGGIVELEQIPLSPRELLAAQQAWPVDTIVASGPVDNRVNVVIVGDGYTSSDMGDYSLHVAGIISGFFDELPLDTYATYFNVHKVDVLSNESGVDEPELGIYRDTALDMAFDCGGISRLLCVNVSKALAAAGSAPAADQVIAIANTTRYGGAGYSSSNLCTVSGNNSSALETALHEFGHSFANLADEYVTGNSTYDGLEHPRANVSIYDANQQIANQTKWYRWITPDQPVRSYEGAAVHYMYGLHRPTKTSKMRSLSQPFYSVNVEQFIFSIYEQVSPIDSATPQQLFPLPGCTSFFVEPLTPVGHTLDIQWSMDGVPVPGEVGTTYYPELSGLSAGIHTVSVTVVDNTPMVRDETLRDQLMTDERSWQIDVGSYSCVCGDGTCEPGEQCADCSADCALPPTTEVDCYDGFDNDCDGAFDCADDDCVSTCCGDGFCDPVEICTCIADCGTPATSETDCSDSLDNDCDGFIDCADVDCQAFCACGDGVCESFERCTCEADCGVVPSTETDCGDLVDNDCDGDSDCDDSDCASYCGISCGDGTCDVTELCTCMADCGFPPISEFNCTDGIDNNCDGNVDCDDANCFFDPACDCGDGTCDTNEICTCVVDCGLPPESETVCDDGLDDDCDGAIDCDDQHCWNDPACLCGNGICAADELCTCVADCGTPPATEADCGDGIDNDCDGDVDCDDADCAVFCACGDGICAADELCTCVADCGTPPATEADCGDGIDNDCDGDTDCDDADCAVFCACGDGICAADELCTCVADCGTPPATEADCGDGIDNDCDGDTDCDDADCAVFCDCGDGICEAEEMCICVVDCGLPLPVETKNCFDGIDNDCDGDVDCDDLDCAGPCACGDGICEIDEVCLCRADCGIPPLFELDCTDGLDNDCDGLADCDDDDCSAYCCGAPGDLCFFGSDCCSGMCNRRTSSCR